MRGVGGDLQAWKVSAAPQFHATAAASAPADAFGADVLA